MSKSRSESDKDSADYAVGNCRPPKETRFKPGQSGNPKGKAKGTIGISAQVGKIFQRKVVVTENGVRLRLSLLEAMLTSFAAKAVKGDLKSAEFLIRMQQRDKDDPAELLNPAILPAEDQELIAAFLRTVQSVADVERSESAEESETSLDEA